MGNPDNIEFTSELLRDYSLAALANASELIAEALLLYRHGHFARAYFLAVASIEETGKAYLAFDGRGRNLRDSTVLVKLKRSLEDHPQKISSAFVAWLIASPDVRSAVMPMVDLMVQLRYGREPSMYTDIRSDSVQIQVPAEMVRKQAAFDCIRLAADCLSHTQRHIAEKTPQPRTPAEDHLFAMKTGQFQKLLGTGDFWWYYIAQLEAGKTDFAEAVVSYCKTYSSAGLLYRKPEETDENGT